MTIVSSFGQSTTVSSSSKPTRMKPSSRIPLLGVKPMDALLRDYFSFYVQHVCEQDVVSINGQVDTEPPVKDAFHTYPTLGKETSRAPPSISYPCQ